MKQQHQWFCDQVERHKVALYRLARSILRSDEDAKDAVAEAVCKAFAHLDSLKQPERFKSWLLRITANEAYNILNRRRRLVSLEDYGREVPAPRPLPGDGGQPVAAGALPAGHPGGAHLAVLLRRIFRPGDRGSSWPDRGRGQDPAEPGAGRR